MLLKPPISLKKPLRGALGSQQPGGVQAAGCCGQGRSRFDWGFAIWAYGP